jgi:hypothetical protein
MQGMQNSISRGPLVSLLIVAALTATSVFAISGSPLKSTVGEVVATVDRERIGTNLAVLTGKTPLASGPTIPERGTVPGREATRQYLASVLKDLGYTVETHDYRTNGQNLLVRLPAATRSDEWILAGAHLDSVSNAGANDNGTGTACVLEMARVLRNLAGRKVNVMLAFFDEEERGLVGSHALAAKFKRENVQVTSVHTIDMMGWDEDKDRALEIERPDGGLWEYYQAVNQRHALGLKLSRTSSGATDHVAFRSAGFRAVGLCEEWAGGDTTPYYHRKTDTFETVDLDYLTSTTRFFTAVIGDLATGTPAPAPVAFIDHDHFPGRDHCGLSQHEQD